MDALNTPDNTGEATASLAIPPWQELRAYRFHIHPDYFIVTTNAPQDCIKACVAKWEADHQAGDVYNLEESIRNAGYFCVTAEDTRSEIQTLEMEREGTVNRTHMVTKFGVFDTDCHCVFIISDEDRIKFRLEYGMQVRYVRHPQDQFCKVVAVIG